MSNNSDIIISLLHWQYWWWFWFSFLISLYYLIIIKYIFSRSIKFNPKIVTSFRTHGKWGDVIICLLPVSWCLNILSNSTTLLKIIEWQSEASIMTLRVRGKQWYWVYKSDIKDLSNLFQSNLVFNKINGGSFNNYYTGADILLFKNNDFSNFINNKKKSNLDFFFNYVDDSIIKESISSDELNYFIKKNKYLNKNFNKQKLISNKIVGVDSNYTNSSQQHFFSNRPDLKKNYVSIFYKNFFNGYEINIDFLKYYKKINHHKYDILIQKSIDNWVKENGINYNNFFNYNLFYDHNSYNNFRLLRVNKSLILPSDSFINVITNSFDVIHSWFIPGLGFKMDCVPGRSTHHNLYIDLPGVYYGQCAEICGRLHHHMPIKLCALQYEHYVVMYMSFNNNNLKNYNKWMGNYF